MPRSIIHLPTHGAYFRGRAVDRFSSAIKAIQWDSITFTVNGRTREVSLNALADAAIARQYNEVLDQSPNVETLIEKLHL